jgi:DNA-binding PadR family transcriptional regulator
MYPILMRLADRGLLETSWESDPPAGRPPRHLYRLTGTGRATAKELSMSMTPAKKTKTAWNRRRLEGT